VTTTTEVEEGRPAALDAATMCAAFQLTAAERAGQVALRTLGDAVSITFAEYASRVRRLAGALHALGVRRGDTVGFMLKNRPEFHVLDTAVMHLGGTPFSIYNTSSPEQIAYLLADAANRVFVFEAAFGDRARRPWPGQGRSSTRSCSTAPRAARSASRIWRRGRHRLKVSTSSPTGAQSSPTMCSRSSTPLAPPGLRRVCS
jgi:acyl-CoA synthetase (AMP-forming)/AMP-acid ligase II